MFANLLIMLMCVLGQQQERDYLMSEPWELSKKKPRGKTDENLVAEMTCLESAITLTKDDLVGLSTMAISHLLPERM